MHLPVRSIRINIMILIVIAIVPALGIIVYTGIEQRSAAISQYDINTRSLVQGVAMQQEQITNSARQLLMTLSSIPAVINGDAAACNAFFRKLLVQNPCYASITIAGSDGMIFAGAPSAQPFSIAERKYFKDVLRKKDFSVGEYVFSRTAGRPVMHFAYPILDQKMNLKGVVVVAFDVAYYTRYFKSVFTSANLPEGSALALTDGEGVRLYRYPAFEQYAGIKDLPGMISRMSAEEEEGSFFAAGVDGKRRLYAYKRMYLAYEKKPDLFIRVGVPEQMVLAGANRNLIRNLEILGVTALLAVGLAIILGNIVIVRPLHSLVKASRQLGQGDLMARTGLAYTNNEVGQLARSFDEMASQLEDRYSERKWAEEKIKELRLEKEQILNSAGEGIIGVNADGDNTFVNPAAAKMLGYEVEEMIGRNSHSIYHHSRTDGSAYPETECPIYNAYRKGKIYHVTDEIFWKKDGSKFPVEYTSTPIMENDRPVGAVLTFKDITERKRSEEAIRESEEKLRTILESVQAGILIIDPETHIIVDANSAAAGMIGAPKEKIAGSVCHNYICAAETGKCPITDLNQTIDHAERILLTEKENNCSVIKTVVKVMLGGREHLIESFIDITERKYLESKLRQAQKMEAIGTLAGGIAHDFNNILGAIMGYTELYKEQVRDRPMVYDCIKEVLRAADRAKDLVRQILTFSRLTTPEKKPVMVVPLVKEVAKFMRASLPTTIEIKTTLKAKSDLIVADATQIHQVLMNLCTNAGHAMKDTGGTLEIGLAEEFIAGADLERFPSLACGRYLRLDVRDTGEGIKAADKEKIYEPYFTTKGKGDGTGLGLAVVHGIINEHRGEIKMYSEVGKGTVFQVYLPLAGEPAVEGDEVEDSVLPGGTESVLFIDDELPLANLGRALLVKLGYKAIAETNPLLAVERFRNDRNAFDLVITDKTMPHMTGLDVAQEVRKIRADIPVIICSGFQHKDDMEKTEALGINAFIEKPIGMHILARTVRKVLDGNKEQKMQING